MIIAIFAIPYNCNSLRHLFVTLDTLTHLPFFLLALIVISTRSSQGPSRIGVKLSQDVRTKQSNNNNNNNNNNNLMTHSLTRT